MSPQSAATAIGLVAIGFWSVLALLTQASGRVPPFQLLAMTFAIAAAAGASSWLVRPGAAKALRQPWPVWLLGIAGLFAYHAVYFAALRAAPPAEASLIAYLWPLLIVLLSAFLPGERLRWHHLAGAFLGFSGVLALALGRGASLEARYALGYGLALACAIIWSGYSVLSRRFKAVPTDAVVGFCLVTALLALPCHVFLEETAWPASAGEWLAVLGLGLGPVGLAFYAWDHGVKRGDIRLLGVMSYATPILSTLILVLAGVAAPTPALALACALIVAGAVLAAKDQILLPRRLAEASEKR
jgi:drug/metabolite transporter (DMT)-like permease